ncbi:hypothetical protein [Archangium sp.]|uniref:hypothetical protein n=1 Tax=Archangium sp. TaxID=1872627 RepID=UPI00286A2422|nr:hypothetical protein [Archangium sp.]
MNRALVLTAVMALSTSCVSTPEARARAAVPGLLEPSPGRCGELVVRPTSLPYGELFSTSEVLFSVGSGSHPHYRPRVAVIDVETLEAKPLAPNGGPALVVGYNHYSIQWFPIGRRLVGSYSLGFAVVDPERLSWTRVDLPEGFTMRPNVITDHEWVFPSHRFDAERGTFKPSPSALQRLGGHWLPFGRSVVAIDPISRTGAEVSLLSGKETPLSFDGFPALAGHVLVWKLAAKQLLVVGQTPPPAQVKASVYDLDARRWLPIADEQLTFLEPDRLTSFTVEGAPGVWMDQPEGPQRPKVLYQLDPKTLTFASHPLPTGISVAAAPNGVFVFDATSLRLFVPGHGEACRWSTAGIPKNQLSGPTWRSPGIHETYVLDAEGGLNPFGTVQRIGKRLLVTSDQADDGNPSCPPGASCLPHDERKVRHNPYSGLIEFR